MCVAELAGEVPPLSRFTMYAHLDPARTSAVLELRVNGVRREVTTLTGFSGPLVEVPWPESVPCAMRWYRDGVRTYVLHHRAATDSERAPLRVSWGYVPVGWQDGAIRERGEFVTLAEGRAWPVD